MCNSTDYLPALQDLDSAQEATNLGQGKRMAAAYQRLETLPPEFDREAVENWKLRRESNTGLPCAGLSFKRLPSWTGCFHDLSRVGTGMQIADVCKP